MGKRNGGYKGAKEKGYREFKKPETKINFLDKHLVCSIILKPKIINQNSYAKSFESNTLTFGLGDAGTGKAQSLDVDILTPTNFVFMGAIKVGVNHC